MPIPHLVILLGFPGAGKSTQGKELAARWEGHTYISTGDALRSQVDDSILGPKIKTMLETGALASDELMLPVVKRILDQHPEGIVFDGFPRRSDQALWLEQNIGHMTIAAIHLDLDIVFAAERLYKRMRDDDTVEIIDKRLKVFQQETEPLLNYYSGKGILHTIDANRPIDDVLNECLRLFD